MSVGRCLNKREREGRILFEGKTARTPTAPAARKPASGKRETVEALLPPLPAVGKRRGSQKEEEEERKAGQRKGKGGKGNSPPVGRSRTPLGRAALLDA